MFDVRPERRRILGRDPEIELRPIERLTDSRTHSTPITNAHNTADSNNNPWPAAEPMVSATVITTWPSLSADGARRVISPW